MTIAACKESVLEASNPRELLIFERLRALDEKVQKVASFLQSTSIAFIVAATITFIASSVTTTTAAIVYVAGLAIYSLGKILASSSSVFLEAKKEKVKPTSLAISAYKSASAQEIAVLNASSKGLVNPLCNCFMNATLQMIFSQKTLSDAFLASLLKLSAQEDLKEPNPTLSVQCDYKDYDLYRGNYKFIKDLDPLEKEALDAQYQPLALRSIQRHALQESEKAIVISALLSYAAGTSENPPEAPLEQIFISLSLQQAAFVAHALMTRWQDRFAPELESYDGALLRACLVKLLAKPSTSEVCLKKFSTDWLDERAYYDESGALLALHYRKIELNHDVIRPRGESADGPIYLLEKGPDGVPLRALDLELKPLDLTLDAILEQLGSTHEKAPFKLTLYQSQEKTGQLSSGSRKKSFLTMTAPDSRIVSAYENGRKIGLYEPRTHVTIPSLTDDEQILIRTAQQVESSEFFMQLIDALCQKDPALSSAFLKVKTLKRDYQKPQVGQEMFSEELALPFPPHESHFVYPRLELKKHPTQQRFELASPWQFDGFMEKKCHEGSSITESHLIFPEHLVISVPQGDFNYETGVNEKSLGIQFVFSSPETFEVDFKECPETRYKLSSFTVHRGSSLRSGHYIEYQRKTGPDGKSYWICHDDNSSTIVQENHIRAILDGKAGINTAQLLLFSKV